MKWDDYCPMPQDCIGYVLFAALHGEPDMYHFNRYGEHVNEWETIL